MGMMIWMGLMMILGISAIIIISLVAIAIVSRFTQGDFNHPPLYDTDEKVKRDRLILTDDGELLEIVDSDWESDQKLKRGL